MARSVEPDESIISAKTYSGCYGGEIENVGDLLVVKVKCPTHAPSLSMKQIIFIVDESGSMQRTMPSARASLFAARDALLQLTESNAINERDRDHIFTEECNVSIITFSASAECKWESAAACRAQGIPSSEVSFSTAVRALEANSSTNLSAALVLAFEKKLPDYATWIVLITDGRPNRGLHQTTEAFAELMLKIPPQTKIIPLGYTTDFDPEILSILGTMIFLDNEEAIAETLGSIMGEIATCYGVRATINLPSLPQETISPEDMIVVPEIIGVARDIIGSRDMDCVYNERRYLYGRLLWLHNSENTPNPLLSQYHGLQGTFSYYDISRKIEVTTPFTIEDGGSVIPDDIREAYFEASKARIILDIYLVQKTDGFNSEYVKNLKRKLEDWKHPCAIEHKQEILRILRTKLSNKHAVCAAFGLASSAKYQTSYTKLGRHTTHAQRVGSVSATHVFRSIQPTHPEITIDLSLLEPIGLQHYTPS